MSAAAQAWRCVGVAATSGVGQPSLGDIVIDILIIPLPHTMEHILRCRFNRFQFMRTPVVPYLFAQNKSFQIANNVDITQSIMFGHSGVQLVM